jgi:anti-anti-sigma factor
MSPNAPSLPFSISGEGNRTTVRFTPGIALTETNAEDIGRELSAALTDREQPHLLLDLGGVAMVSSIALAKFIALNKQARAAGGRLTLFNLTPPVHQVLKLTRLDTVLEVHAAPHAIPA